ncbi:MAG: hypothetical protein N3H31_03780 [Candidatus Nezhaarchaeota archaeon]|nr:hypothetical protein [Candidatus Nezhaarchaeota archaeon]
MPRAIGLFKELEEDEQLLYESKDSLPLVLTRELVVKKLVGSERKEHPILYAVSTLYLTSRRLLLLTLHQAESSTLLEHGAPRVPLRSGAWLEVPINSVASVEPRLIDVKANRELARFIEWAGVREVVSGHVPAAEVIYDCGQAVGRVADYVKLIFEMGLLVKDQHKVEAQVDKAFLIGEEAASNLPFLLREVLKSQRLVKASRGEAALA